MKRCLFCEQDVPDIVWRDDRPGGHLVLVREHGGIRFEGGRIDADGTLWIVAQEPVRLMLCRDITTVATGRTEPAIGDVRVDPPHPAQLATERWVAEHDQPRGRRGAHSTDHDRWPGVRAFWRFVAERRS